MRWIASRASRESGTNDRVPHLFESVRKNGVDFERAHVACADATRLAVRPHNAALVGGFAGAVVPGIDGRRAGQQGQRPGRTAVVRERAEHRILSEAVVRAAERTGYGVAAFDQGVV